MIVQLKRVLIMTLVAMMLPIFAALSNAQAASATSNSVRVVRQIEIGDLDSVRFSIRKKFKKGIHPALLRFKNPNSVPVKVYFKDENYKVFKSAVILANGIKFVKIKAESANYQVTFVDDVGQEVPFQGGQINLLPF